MQSHENRSVILSKERFVQMVEAGAWENKLLSDHFSRWVQSVPDKIAVKSFSLDRGEVHTLTFSRLDTVANQVACAFQRLGVGYGDVVSFQLENRWEFTAVALACERIGAIANPLMPVLRDRELSYMLSLSESKILIVPKSFRGFDFKSMALELKRKISTLLHVLVLDDSGEVGLGSIIDNDGVLDGAHKPSANDLMEILFISGTTGETKGAMHTANTLFSNIREYAKRFAFCSDDVIFYPTPLAHQLGSCMGC